MLPRSHDQDPDTTTPLIAKHTTTGSNSKPWRMNLRFGFASRTWLDKAVTLILLAGSVSAIVCLFFDKTHTSPLTSCLTDADVPFVVKGSKDWATTILPWNVRLSYTPAAVAIPQSVHQIQAAVSCGIRNHVRISAKGGGHSFGSYGLGGEDGHLVIDLQQLNKVTVHKNGTADIQPGARLGHVSLELYKQGRRAIPHGACPGVGLAGHVLHGGYGRASRTQGLTLDWMSGAKVILSNGSMVHCSATENHDLFWALRGAGSSFGIVAEFEFNTFGAPEHVTPFTIELPWDEKSAAESLKALQNFAMTAPSELNMFLFVTTSDQVIQGLYFGEEAGLTQEIQPLLARLNTKISYMKTVGWLEGLQHYADGEPLDSPSPYNSHGTFYTTSLTTPALTDSQINSLASAMFANINETSARHSWDIFFEMHGGPKSAVSLVNTSETAYPHRDKVLLWQLSDAGENGNLPEESFANLKQLINSVTHSMADKEWGMYANFIDTELDGEMAQRLYYRDNLPRLRAIKAQLDPGNVFWNPQGISTSS